MNDETNYKITPGGQALGAFLTPINNPRDVIRRDDDLKSPVVLRSEFEELLSLARDMYKSLDFHCGDPITKAYKLRIEKYDG